MSDTLSWSSSQNDDVVLLVIVVDVVVAVISVIAVIVIIVIIVVIVVIVSLVLVRHLTRVIEVKGARFKEFVLSYSPTKPLFFGNKRLQIHFVFHVFERATNAVLMFLLLLIIQALGLGECNESCESMTVNGWVNNARQDKVNQWLEIMRVASLFTFKKIFTFDL